MTGARASKNTIVELILLALGDSKLRDMGLGAMRGVLQSDPRLAVLDGSVDLQSVWELLEGQPGFEPQAALGPFCFLKTLEPRLQVTIQLPPPLRGLSDTEITRNAGTCRPDREEVERAIKGEIDSGRARPVKPESGPSWTVPPALEYELTPRKKILALVSLVVVVVSVAFVAWTIMGNIASEPKFRQLDTALFAGDIPLRSAQTWGSEVHATLADPAWLKEPEDKRKKQLEGALGRLADQQVSVLIIEDDARRTRATAQWFGRPPKLFVKFY
jgi:hypothetical protein